jgi:hypothetical protein
MPHCGVRAERYLKKEIHEFTRIYTGQPSAATKRYFHHEAREEHEGERKRSGASCLGPGDMGWPIDWRRRKIFFNHEWTRTNTGQPLAATKRYIHHEEREEHEGERRRSGASCVGAGGMGWPIDCRRKKIFFNHEWTRMNTNDRCGSSVRALTTYYTEEYIGRQTLQRVLARDGRHIVARGDAKRALGPLIHPAPNSPSGAA